jgi:hypothetical protein
MSEKFQNKYYSDKKSTKTTKEKEREFINMQVEKFFKEGGEIKRFDSNGNLINPVADTTS